MGDGREADGLSETERKGEVIVQIICRHGCGKMRDSCGLTFPENAGPSTGEQWRL